MQRAVVKESLRMNHAVVNPMTRVVPKGGASIGGHFVPEGVSIFQAGISGTDRLLRPLLG